jgi:hypothetical protein
MLILLVVAIALEIIAFLIPLPNDLMTSIVGATAAGVIGILGSEAVLVVSRHTFLGRSSKTYFDDGTDLG